MQCNVGLRRGVVGLEARHLLQLGERHHMLAGFGRRRGNQQGLLRGNSGGWQMRGPDLFCHQLLFDLVD